MTADEAKQALKEGFKVRNKKWGEDDYLEYCLVATVEKVYKANSELIFKEFKDDWEILD